MEPISDAGLAMCRALNGSVDPHIVQALVARLDAAEKRADGATNTMLVYERSLFDIRRHLGLDDEADHRDVIAAIERLVVDGLMALTEEQMRSLFGDAQFDRDARDGERAVKMALLQHRAEMLEAERDRLRALAYTGEHHFPDLTWKARCEELVPKLRAVEDERDRLREENEALRADRCIRSAEWDARRIELVQSRCRELEAERNRLREALKALIEHESPSGWPWSEGVWRDAENALRGEATDGE